jgi:glucose-6-phosphate 1-dehydrogenase
VGNTVKTYLKHKQTNIQTYNQLSDHVKQSKNNKTRSFKIGSQCLRPVILATKEAEIRRITEPWQIVLETPS